MHVFFFPVGFVYTSCAEVEEVDVKVPFLPDYFPRDNVLETFMKFTLIICPSIQNKFLSLEI